MPDDTALLLERHFDTAFAAPDGIQKLRELILTLAMQGKLVPQDPNDQPASELLKAIELEKERLVKEGKIKQSKPLMKINSGELPYELPHGWEWVRLGNCMLKITDGTHHSPINTEKGDFLYISAKNIKDDGVLLQNASYVTKEIHEEIFSGCNPEYGNILYVKDGATTGIATINNLLEPFSMLSSVALFKQPKQVDNHYLLFTLRSPFFYNAMRLGMMGVAITRVTLKKLKDAIVPLPPLAEQHRIVAKIAQLMARCDELEELRRDRAQKLITVHTAAIDRLLTAKDSRDFSTAWQFITQHFDELYSVKETVTELRKTILQLAVMGKLVPQDPTDEPASELLEKVADERSRLLSNKEIREEKSLISISDPELKDLQIPIGWMAVHLGEVIYCLDYKRKPIKQDNRGKGEIPYYGANGRVGWIDNYIFDESLVLVVEDETFIGRTLPFSYKIKGKSWVNNHAHVLKPSLAIEIDFLNHSLSYYPFTKLASGTTGRKKLTKTTLLNIPYMFPPLAEQHRIVAKVNQLMALCDRLEEAIATAQAKQTDLLNAVMAQV